MLPITRRVSLSSRRGHETHNSPLPLSPHFQLSGYLSSPRTAASPDPRVVRMRETANELRNEAYTVQHRPTRVIYKNPIATRLFPVIAEQVAPPIVR